MIYAGLTDREALDVLRAQLPHVVLAPAYQPLADLPSDHKIESFEADGYDAIITGPANARVRLSSTAPLRVEGDDEQWVPVDLSLRRIKTGYRLVNGYARVHFPDALSDGVSVGRLTLRFDDARAGSTAMQVADSLVWPNVATDTDAIGNTAGPGAQLSLTLRSAQSPEDFSFSVTATDGSTARVSKDLHGRLAVVDADGHDVGTITEPTAWDADRKPVTTEWQLVDGQLTLHIDHHRSDVAYPLLVDPLINDDRWTNTLALYHWPYAGLANRVQDRYGDFGSGWGPGMYQIQNDQPPNPHFYQNGEQAFWYLNLVGRTARALQVAARSMNHDTGANAIGGPATCTYFGIWSNANASWDELAPVRCDTYRNYDDNAGSWLTSTGSPGNAAIIGLFANGDGTRGYFQQKVGILTVALRDDDQPRANISGIPGWTDNPNASISASATDAGLGVRLISFTADGQPNWSGAISSEPPGCQLPSKAICSTGPVWATTTVGNLLEGITTVRVHASDPVNQINGANSPGTTDHTTIMVDRSPPQLNLGGSLTTDPQPFWVSKTLTITATDGDASSNLTARSGVARIEVYLDGELERAWDQSCPAGSCSMSKTYLFNGGMLGGGTHDVDIMAYDQLGHDVHQHLSVDVGCCFAAHYLSGIRQSQNVLADVNGDVTADLITLQGTTVAVQTSQSGFSTANSWAIVPPKSQILAGDINGDGKADLVVRAGTTILIGFSNGQSFGVLQTVSTSWPTSEEMHVGDVDGDTYADLIGRDPSTGEIYVALSIGSKIKKRNLWATGPTGKVSRVADVDGDQLDDVVVASNAGYTVLLSIGDSFAVPLKPTATAIGSGDWHVADINSDGMADLIEHPTSDPNVHVRFGFDTGFQSHVIGFNTTAVNVDYGDVTGDFKADLVEASGQNLLVHPSIAALPHAPYALSYEYPPGTPLDPADNLVAAANDESATQNVASLSAPTGDTGMRLAAQDQGQLVGAVDLPSDDAALDATKRDRIYDRYQQMGISVVRFNAFWGSIENVPSSTAPYDWAFLDQAIGHAITRGFKVYITLTGVVSPDGDCEYSHDPYGNAHQLNPHAIGCKSANVKPFDSGTAPAESGPNLGTWIDRYGAFVQAAFEHFSNLGSNIIAFGVWNEPNLPAFLNPPATINPRSGTAATWRAQRYRQLYERARLALSTAKGHGKCSDCQLLLGDFSEQRRGGLSATDFLLHVAPANGPKLITDGIAWHPYQHRMTPTMFPKGASDDGIGKTEQIQNIITALTKEGRLSKPSGARPPLYYTEFGYFNRPYQDTETSAAAVRTEAARAKWWPLALDRAAGLPAQPGGKKGVPAKWMLIYQAVEFPDVDFDPYCSPLGPQAKKRWDTGLFAAPSLDLADPTAPIMRPAQVNGTRCYGVGKNGGPQNFMDPQQRKAFCAIRDWAKRHKYSVTDPDPNDPAGQCP